MAAPEAYVRKLMVNAVSSRWRRPGWGREWLRGALPERPLPPEDTGVVDHAVVWPLVRALPDRQRAVVVMPNPRTLGRPADIAAIVAAKATGLRPARSP